ncbi:MAG: acyltransferase [Prevotella sp.]|nr:acyltransferase [Prevotella sp.]
MNKQILTRNECNALRGLAIIGIFLHNYCHWLGPIVKENEYQYFQKNVDALNVALTHPDSNLPLHLLSFFGHYGVPIFLFLSAYGLVMKYERKPDVSVSSHSSASVIKYQLSQIWDFIRYHYLKLFKMMIVGFVAFTMVDAITPGRFHYDFLGVVAQLLMFNNVLPTPDKIIWPGPYWFFGLMLQLYIVYRLFLYRRHWGFAVALIIICEIIQLSCNPEGEALNRWRYNFIGGMLPFGIGLLTARHGEPFTYQLSAIIIVPSIYMVFYFCDGFFNWTLVPLAIIFTNVCLVKLLQPKSNNIISSLLGAIFRFLQWMGSISAALFVCHPITRKIFIPISRQGNFYTGLLLYIIASICLAWLFNELMKRIPNPSQAK